MPSLLTWIGIGAFALFALFLSATFFPAFAMAILFIILIIGIAVAAPQFAVTPAGIGIIIVLIALTAIFGLVQVGQTASLSVVHAIP